MKVIKGLSIFVGGIIMGVVLLAVRLQSVAAADPIRIQVSPQNGAIIEGTTVTATISADGIILSPATDDPRSTIIARNNQLSAGVIKLWLDLWPVVVVRDDNAYTFTNVPPGQHQLKVELVNQDLVPLSPPVVENIRFETIPILMLPETGQTPALEFLLLLAIGFLMVIAGLIGLTQNSSHHF
ncbi:MAG: hypothetical protein U0401_26065 [Anaerolineae bacterium]